MAKYILKRILYMFFVLFIMSFLLFFLYNLVPGDPARAEVEAIRETATPEEYQFAYEAARERLGLDDPGLVRYGKWMKGLSQGDLGQSSVYNKPVRDIIMAPLRVTIFINIFVIILALGITIPLGISTAVRRNTAYDKAVQVLTIVGYSIPQFIFALLFIFAFSVKLGWFPVSGMATPNIDGSWWFLLKDKIWHLTLPVGVLLIASLGGVTRYVRAAMSDALSMDYIRTARAKGVKERVVIYSHAWRNALLPVITLIIGWIMTIFSGALVVESMFNLNGMGKFYIDALNRRDFDVALAIQMFYTVIALLGVLITDISYGLVDPRVRVDK